MTEIYICVNTEGRALHAFPTLAIAQSSWQTTYIGMKGKTNIVFSKTYQNSRETYIESCQTAWVVRHDNVLAGFIRQIPFSGTAQRLHITSKAKS